MPKVTVKKATKVTVNIRRGPASPAQKVAWRKFWIRVLNKEGKS